MQSQTQNQRGWHGAARGEHLLQAQDELCCPLPVCSSAHTGFVKQPHGLSQSRRLLKPPCGLKIGAILGTSQGEPPQGAWCCKRSAGNMGPPAATGCWGFIPSATQFLQHPPCLCNPNGATNEGHQQLRLCLSLDASLRVHPQTSLPFFPLFSPLPDGPVLLHRRPEGRDPLPPLRPERALLHPLHLAHPPLRRCPRAPPALRLARWVPRCSGCCQGTRGLPPHSQGSWVPASPAHGCSVLGVCVPLGSSLAQGCPR